MRYLTSIFVLASLLAGGVCQAHPAVKEYSADLRAGSAEVRRNAALSLGRLGDRSAVPALVKALDDADARVRAEAARALGLIKDPQAVAPLVRLLRDADVNVRTNAAYALGEIKEPKAAGALLEALKDPVWAVRDQAAWALRELHDPKVAGPLAAALVTENADAEQIVWILRHLEGTEKVTKLTAMLRNPRPQARMRAAWALGELRDEGALDPLVAALKDPDAGVRLSVIKALVALDSDRTEAPVQRLLAAEKDPAVRQAAEELLRGTPRNRSLIAHWSFDDGTAKDLTGGGSDGEVKGCVSVPGKMGKALKFGPGQYVELGQPAGFRMGGRAFTVTAWLKPEVKTGVVVARGGAFCGFSLYLKEGIPKFGIHLEQDGPTYIAAGREVALGAWTHLAGVVKVDCVELYVNGKLAGTAETPAFIPGEAGQGMEIGFDVGNSPAEITDSFEGLIDEVKVYQLALGEAELAKEIAASE